MRNEEGTKMADFKAFWGILVTEIGSLAKSQLPEMWKTAEQDGKNFIEKSRKKLEEWTKQLANAELSKDDFGFLVKGLKDLTEMEALKQAGLALVQIDRFKNAVMDTIVGTAFKVFL
jgi:hypothetical protein